MFTNICLQWSKTVVEYQIWYQMLHSRNWRTCHLISRSVQLCTFQRLATCCLCLRGSNQWVMKTGTFLVLSSWYVIFNMLLYSGLVVITEFPVMKYLNYFLLYALQCVRRSAESTKWREHLTVPHFIMDFYSTYLLFYLESRSRGISYMK